MTDPTSYAAGIDASEPTPSGHEADCGWQLDQYPWECTCGAVKAERPAAFGCAEIEAGLEANNALDKATDQIRELEGEVARANTTLATVWDKGGIAALRDANDRAEAAEARADCLHRAAETAREALYQARLDLVTLAERGTERIRDLGVEVDDAERTYAPFTARIDDALAALSAALREGGEG